MENMKLYNAVRAVPQEAKKTIGAGRLKGMTDINPMWRIKVLTEQFGVCGFGWRTQLVRTWIEEGANNERTANVELLLFIKMDGEWSEGIVGIGGASFVSNERNGLYTDDECYKKAYTDAISVACKALGIGADVYFEKDRTKYDSKPGTTPTPAPAPTPAFVPPSAATLMEADAMKISIEAVAAFLKKKVSEVSDTELAACIEQKKARMK